MWARRRWTRVPEGASIWSRRRGGHRGADQHRAHVRHRTRAPRHDRALRAAALATTHGIGPGDGHRESRSARLDAAQAAPPLRRRAAAVPSWRWISLVHARRREAAICIRVRSRFPPRRWRGGRRARGRGRRSAAKPTTRPAPRGRRGPGPMRGGAGTRGRRPWARGRCVRSGCGVRWGCRPAAKERGKPARSAARGTGRSSPKPSRARGLPRHRSPISRETDRYSRARDPSTRCGGAPVRSRQKPGEFRRATGRRRPLRRAAAASSICRSTISSSRAAARRACARA